MRVEARIDRLSDGHLVLKSRSTVRTEIRDDRFHRCNIRGRRYEATGRIDGRLVPDTNEPAVFERAFVEADAREQLTG